MKKLLTIMASAIMLMTVILTSMPEAFSEFTPSTHAGDPIPAFGPPGTLFSMQTNQALDPGAPDNTNIHNFKSGVLLDIFPFDSIPTDVSGGMAYRPDPGDKFCLLVKTSDLTPRQTRHFDIRDTVSQIYDDDNRVIPGSTGFGSGGFADPGVFIPSTNTPSPNGEIIGGGTSEWREQTPAAVYTILPGACDMTTTPTDGINSRYVYIVWSFVDIPQAGQPSFPQPDGVFNGAPEVDATVTRSFNIIRPVGGFSIGVDTTALLVAGAQTNAFWILPILGLAGTVLVIRKLEKPKKA